MNCFSIDVEGFLEASIDSCGGQVPPIDRAAEDYEIRTNVDVILPLLAEFGVRATWFFLGRIAEDIPSLVRDVAAAGHEIGCHGLTHRRISVFTEAEFRARTLRAKELLEDVSGTSVNGFRAPEFSVTPRTRWAIDVLREIGFTYDSSVVPTRLHDVYGLPDADPGIFLWSNGLVEFPIPTASFLGQRIPFGGGGYFRLYPLSVTSALMSRANDAGQPVMFYIHPYEVGPVLPAFPGLSRARRFRHFHQCGNVERVRELLRRFRFATAADVLGLQAPAVAPTA